MLQRDKQPADFVSFYGAGTHDFAVCFKQPDTPGINICTDGRIIMIRHEKINGALGIITRIDRFNRLCDDSANSIKMLGHGFKRMHWFILPT
jgi:hypothetical protein